MIYDDAGLLFSRLTRNPLLGLLDGSAFTTWRDVPDLLPCLRPALGLDQMQPGDTEPEVERYVLCTGLRAAAIEAGAAEWTDQATP